MPSNLCITQAAHFQNENIFTVKAQDEMCVAKRAYQRKITGRIVSVVTIEMVDFRMIDGILATFFATQALYL